MASNLITLNIRANNGQFNDVLCPQTFDANTIRIGNTVKLFYDIEFNQYNVYSNVTKSGDIGGLEIATVIYVGDRYYYCQESSSKIQELINACCNSRVIYDEYELKLSLESVSCEGNLYRLDLYLKSNRQLELGSEIEIKVGNTLNNPISFRLIPHHDCVGLTTASGSKLTVVYPASLTTVNGCKFIVYVSTAECLKKTFNVSILSVTPVIVYATNQITTVYNP